MGEIDEPELQPLAERVGVTAMLAGERAGGLVEATGDGTDGHLRGTQRLGPEGGKARATLQRLQEVLDAPPPWLAKILGVEAKSLSKFVAEEE